MNAEMRAERATWNGCRYRPGDPAGHYESYFQRANHPSEPLAFWIRYTLFSPRGRPAEAVGELWAIVFDGLAGRITAVKEVIPLAQCAFSAAGLDVRLGAASLREGQLAGEAVGQGHRIGWSLTYSCAAAPLLLLQRRLYSGGFPKAKSLVGAPLARYEGALVIDGAPLAVDGWIGSQNHNWGSQHTDEYAWGQVAGFDDAPEAFLECITARTRIGPWFTPWLTLAVLRVGGRELALNSLLQSVRAVGRFRFFEWTFTSAAAGERLSGRIEAPASAFVGLTYANPPGGAKTCLNTKLAACTLTLERRGAPALRLHTRHRAAFEILTDRSDHGVPIAA